MALLCDREQVLISAVAISGNFKIGANVGCKAFNARGVQRFLVFCNRAAKRASFLAIVSHCSDDFRVADVVCGVKNEASICKVDAEGNDDGEKYLAWMHCVLVNLNKIT